MKTAKILTTIVSLLLIGTVRFILPDRLTETAHTEPVVQLDIEEIEIVEVPYVSAARDKITLVEAELKRGSNLNDLLLENGLSRDEASSVVYEISPFIDLRYIQAGEIFELKYINEVFSGLKMLKTDKLIVEVVRDLKAENGFRAFESERELKTFVVQASGEIEANLYNAALDSGMNANILDDLIKLLQYDVDFQRDIQQGDTFHVAFEGIFDEEGEMVSEGRILMAQLITDGRDISFYYYEDLSGKGDYYNGEGKTIRKTLLKTPIDGARVSSGFGNRVSPITGFTHRHRGIDFAAPPGTRIYASGDGVVTYAGYNSVYGYHVEIRHVNEYTTLYAHMTNYRRGLRKGIRVNQGSVIGYVGSTGMSTGPHLHYEISYRGVKVNPLSVKSPPGRTLSGEDLILFQNLKESYIASLR